MHRKDLIGWTDCESRVRFASIYGRDVFVQLRLIIYIHVKVNWFSLFNMISQCIYDTFIHVNRRKVSFINVHVKIPKCIEHGIVPLLFDNYRNKL